MPTDARIRQHAEMIVDTCFTVEKGDTVTIICDDEHAALARVVAQVASERGAWPVIMNNETQVANGLSDTLFPMAPPKNLHDAMLAADEIIIMTNLEWANRFAHVSAVKESCANNVKIASVDGGLHRVAGGVGAGHLELERWVLLGEEDHESGDPVAVADPQRLEVVESLGKLAGEQDDEPAQPHEHTADGADQPEHDEMGDRHEDVGEDAPSGDVGCRSDGELRRPVERFGRRRGIERRRSRLGRSPGGLRLRLAVGVLLWRIPETVGRLPVARTL